MRTGLVGLVAALLIPAVSFAGEPGGAGCGCLCLRPPITFASRPPAEIPSWCGPLYRAPVKFFNVEQQPPTWCPPIPAPPVKLCCVQHPPVPLKSLVTPPVTFCALETKPPLWKPGQPIPPIKFQEMLDTPPRMGPNVVIPSVKLLHRYQPPYPACPACGTGTCGK
jgi:hypothetical protein